MVYLLAIYMSVHCQWSVLPWTPSENKLMCCAHVGIEEKKLKEGTFESRPERTCRSGEMLVTLSPW